MSLCLLFALFCLEQAEHLVVLGSLLVFKSLLLHLLRWSQAMHLVVLAFRPSEVLVGLQACHFASHFLLRTESLHTLMKDHHYWRA